jgi:stage II sporulation protein D
MDRRYKLWIALWASVLMAASIMIPSILVKRNGQESFPIISTIPQMNLEKDQDQIQIPVYLVKEKRIETVPLEHYVRGVIAAEMPVGFELEALKAQAIAARTYILRRMTEQDYSNVPVEGAWVTDTVLHQVYLTEEKLKQKWDLFTFANNMSKINQAVMETEGLIVTYEQQPINATFFSTSNGFTENSEDYWSATIPYLRSVPSPWDENISPRYQETISLPYQTVLTKLGISDVEPAIVQTAPEKAFKVLEMTEGNRVKTVKIGNQTFTGREVREKLGLNSSQFQWRWNGNQIEFTTFGYGHGVGMSQWGANGMAMEGKKAEDIIKYYYQGVEIKKI